MSKLDITQQDITQLIKLINQSIDFDNKLAKQDKNSFNIFEALRIETKEEILHSRLICSLFKKEINNGLYKDFLSLFLKKSELREAFDPPFDINNFSCETEHHIGSINDSKITGGSIDILLVDSKKNAIIIENKIHAGDQPKQLKRYHNFGKSKFGNKKFKLIYLTLFKQKASDESEDGLVLGTDYINITYQKHIKEWIEECKSIAIDYPNTRQILDQYLKIIKKLTNQLMSPFMDNEISKLLEEDKNWKVAKLLAQGLNKHKGKLYNDAEEALIKFQSDKQSIVDSLDKSTNTTLNDAIVIAKEQHEPKNYIFKIDIECETKAKRKFWIVIQWSLPKEGYDRYLKFNTKIWDYNNDIEWKHNLEVENKKNNFKLMSNDSNLKYESVDELKTILQAETIKVIKASEDFNF